MALKDELTKVKEAIVDSSLPTSTKCSLCSVQITTSTEDYKALIKSLEKSNTSLVNNKEFKSLT